jgi:AcrR family transcriptional regulator
VAYTPGTHDGEQAPTTRDQLVRAAIEIAANTAASGDRPIGRGTVDVTHGLVRHYFGTRQAMLDEALEQAIDEDITALTLATAHPEAFADGVFTTEDERGDHPPAPSALARSRSGVHRVQPALGVRVLA